MPPQPRNLDAQTSMLSADTLYEVFRWLDVVDLRSVSLVCRQFNDVCAPLLFRDLKLAWSDLDGIERSVSASIESNIDIYAFDRRLGVFQTVKISPDGPGEWRHSPQLPALAKAGGNAFYNLGVECALRSSGWLKYVAPLYSIREFELTTSGVFENYAFDFAHVAESLPNLESISLGDVAGGFLIDPFPASGLTRLSRIRAENCEWLFPFRLAEAGKNSQLRVLEIAYSKHMYAFAFSERFGAEFGELPPTLICLKVDVNIGQRLNWNPLRRCSQLPELKSANISGFEYDYTDRSKFPKLIDYRFT